MGQQALELAGNSYKILKLYEISEQVSFGMIGHLRNPVVTGEVESSLVSDPGFLEIP